MRRSASVAAAFFAWALTAMGGGGAAAQSLCADPSAVCARTLSASCLQRFGAGAALAKADGACAADFGAYRECLTRAVEECGAAAAPAGAESEARAAYEAVAGSKDPKRLELVAERFKGTFWALLAAEEAAALRQGRAPGAPSRIDPAGVGFVRALRTELAANVARLEAFLADLDASGATPVQPSDWPRLRIGFFNATENPAYFAAPADWLSDLQDFYAEIDAVVTSVRAHKLFSGRLGSETYARRQIKKKLTETVARGRADLLPRIDAALAAP